MEQGLQTGTSYCPRDVSHFGYAQKRENSASISVIIPTLNEAPILGATLDSIHYGENVEIIVADGGSSDSTMEIVRSHNVRSVETPACRALQMNAGAREASGDILLFLHADTRFAQRVGNSCSQYAGPAGRSLWRFCAEPRRERSMVAINRRIGQFSIA